MDIAGGLQSLDTATLGGTLKGIVSTYSM